MRKFKELHRALTFEDLYNREMCLALCSLSIGERSKFYLIERYSKKVSKRLQKEYDLLVEKIEKTSKEGWLELINSRSNILTPDSSYKGCMITTLELFKNPPKD